MPITISAFPDICVGRGIACGSERTFTIVVIHQLTSKLLCKQKSCSQKCGNSVGYISNALASFHKFSRHQNHRFNNSKFCGDLLHEFSENVHAFYKRVVAFR